MKYSIIFFIFLLLTPHGVLALGISPGRTEIPFEAGLEKELTVTVYNEDPTPQTIDLYVKGDLANFLTLSTTQIVIPANGKKDVLLTLRLPASPLKEGLLDTRIGAVQTLPEGVGNAVAKIAVESQLWVLVPITGKALAADLDAADAESGMDVEMVLTITNIGTEDTEATPEISISHNEEIARLSLDTFPIGMGEKKTITEYYPSTNLPEGLYLARATVFYNGKNVTAEDSFVIGELLPETAKSDSSSLPLLLGVLLLAALLVVWRKRKKKR